MVSSCQRLFVRRAKLMVRFYHPLSEAETLQPEQLTVELDAEQSHHGLKTLRLKPGQAIELFNGRGRVAQGQVEAVRSGRLVARIERVEEFPPLQPRLVLACAVPKGARADDMVHQLSQAGADVLVPLITQRSVVRPSKEHLASRYSRWRRIAIEAAKQCRRNWTLELAGPANLSQVLREPADLRLIAVPGEGEVSLKELEELVGCGPTRVRTVQVLIGPEGGWSEEEKAQAVAAGARMWSLGPLILRVETAAVAAAVILRYLSSQPQEKHLEEESIR